MSFVVWKCLWRKSKLVLNRYRQIHLCWKTLKQGLALQRIGWTDHYQNEKIKKKKGFGLIKDELFEKIMKRFVGLRANAYSYLIDDGSEDKKAKSIKMWVIKRKHEFENYKNCLEATPIENKINHLEKHEIGKNCSKKYHS